MTNRIPWPGLTQAQENRLAKAQYLYPLAKVIGYDKNSDEMEPLVTLNGYRKDAQILDRSGRLV